MADVALAQDPVREPVKLSPRLAEAHSYIDPDDLGVPVKVSPRLATIENPNPEMPRRIMPVAIVGRAEISPTYTILLARGVCPWGCMFGEGDQARPAPIEDVEIDVFGRAGERQTVKILPGFCPRCGGGVQPVLGPGQLLAAHA